MLRVPAPPAPVSGITPGKRWQEQRLSQWTAAPRVCSTRLQTRGTRMSPINEPTNTDARLERASAAKRDSLSRRQTHPGERRSGGDRRVCFDRRDLIRFDADRRRLFDRRDDAEFLQGIE